MVERSSISTSATSELATGSCHEEIGIIDSSSGMWVATSRTGSEDLVPTDDC